MRTINIDMDGVVADFNSYTGQILGRKIGWEGRDLSDEEWLKLTQTDHLYLRLPLIIESVELVRLARSFPEEFNVRFLTAIPRRTTMPTAEDDKKLWVSRYFNGVPVEVGPYSKDKQKWCKPLDILIDDKKSNVTEWMEAGGISVYHIGNWPETIDNFKKAIKIDKPTIFGPLA